MLWLSVGAAGFWWMDWDFAAWCAVTGIVICAINHGAKEMKRKSR